MPIYEYKCNQCEHQLEMLQKISDGPAKTCPECGEDSLRKLVSAAAFKLKGTGWYETDFKDKKPKKDNKASDNTKTETKKSADPDSKTTNNDSKSSSKTNKVSEKPSTKNSESG